MDGLHCPFGKRASVSEERESTFSLPSAPPVPPLIRIRIRSMIMSRSGEPFGPFDYDYEHEHED